MDIVKLLILLIMLLTLLVSILLYELISIRKKHIFISEILDEIKEGNPNRRILARNNEITADICYKINDIIAASSSKIAELEKSDMAYKQLMTSLSHDVRTPLTSLIGYLDAIHNKIVDGTEKDEYVEIARNKAYNLKDFIDMLFEWFKLDSKERIFHFENIDINELTRSIIADWIPSFDKNAIKFSIDIPEAEYYASLDVVAYARIINNIIQNSMLHSNGTQIGISIVQKNNTIEVTINDNGKGIAKKEIPYVFDRLNKCDTARSNKGNGLGLSIVKELVTSHNGSISVESVPYDKTSFTITLPANKAL